MRCPTRLRCAIGLEVAEGDVDEDIDDNGEPIEVRSVVFKNNPDNSTRSLAFRELSNMKRLKCMGGAALQFNNEDKTWSALTNASAQAIVDEINQNLAGYMNTSAIVAP